MKDLRFWIESTLRSYSIVFFSRSVGLGVFILAATLTFPSHGLFGLGGAILANLIAYALGLSRQEIRLGYWGFNGVLIALGLSLYYQVSPQLIFLIFISLIFMTLVTVWIKQFLATQGLPYMSIPFNLIIYAAIMASFATGYLTPSVARWQLFESIVLDLPPFFNLFFKNLGAIFFNISPICGMGIALGLLVYSRLSLLLIFVGWSVGYQVHEFLGVQQPLIEQQYLGFNYMLTALALGGVFVIPSLSTLFLAVLGVFIAALNLLALETAFPYYLSSLALSFNMAVLFTVYALRMRQHPSLGIELTTELLSPEDNLSSYRENLKQWRRLGVQVSLPFYGEWTVTQAFHGEHTHKEEWAYGYDFMIYDDAGAIYDGDGTKAEDYHCFGAPVLATADGKVVGIKNDVADNLPGQTNSRDNWGNCVIIEHAPYYFSCIAHLKKGSIGVKVGDAVKKGAAIGQCGNSGRSPYPHIHLQFQAFDYIGAPSFFFQFAYIMRSGSAGKELLPRGVIAKDALVSNLQYESDYTRYFQYDIHREWDVAFTRDGAITREKWRLSIDFYNNIFLESDSGDRLYIDFSEGVLTVRRYEGKRSGALCFIAQSLVDVPFPADSAETQWRSTSALDYLLPPLLVHIMDFLAIFGLRFFAQTDNTLTRDGSGLIHLRQEMSIYMAFLKWPLRLKQFLQPRNAVFHKGLGMRYLKQGENELIVEEHADES